MKSWQTMIGLKPHIIKTWDSSWAVAGKVDLNKNEALVLNKKCWENVITQNQQTRHMYGTTTGHFSEIMNNPTHFWIWTNFF